MKRQKNMQSSKAKREAKAAQNQPQYMRRKKAEGFKSNALFFSGIDGDSMMSLPFNLDDNDEIVFGETMAQFDEPSIETQKDEVMTVAKVACQNNGIDFAAYFVESEEQGRFYALVKPISLPVELETVIDAFSAFVKTWETVDESDFAPEPIIDESESSSSETLQ